MKSLLQRFSVPYQYPVHFTQHVFAPENPVLTDTLLAAGRGPHRVLCVVDEGVLHGNTQIVKQIEAYFQQHRDLLTLVRSPLLISGGEAGKNGSQAYKMVQAAIHRHGICRQSFVIAIGGGALLDLVGYAAGTAHRGVRLVRMPTTVLSQNDSGVGVKNSVNAFEKKNFLGTFSPPFAVINDFAFLTSLTHRDWMGGTAEAVKVALLKDPDFFDFIEANAAALVAHDEAAMKHLVHRSAELHLRHIGQGGDPFETRSSRPLDFGHWSAHKLEQLTNFELRHGEAVAIGIALDSTYSYLDGLLPVADWERILTLLSRLGFSLAVPEAVERLVPSDDPRALLHGLTEFREHLGGELTITLLRGIGETIEVHRMEEDLLVSSANRLRDSSWQDALSAPVPTQLSVQLSAV
jgi:3-dehydroquinate synthase